ncbi:MAG: type I-E CRISPR-associated protein Cas7/Cse4/CasC [Rhodospirillales bacterium]|nr:type I-E CRISPR-associated protein Cas7/Cse4/CasC [Rhodospirillales bacterium]
MSRFLQLHVLTSYPAVNLNRDDTGRPKTLVYGGADRLRISSQSLKRAWRTAPEFAQILGVKAIGARTQEFAHSLRRTLVKDRGLDKEEANKRIRQVIVDNKLGKLEAKSKDSKEEPIETNQLVHLGGDELAALEGLADRILDNSPPDKPDKKEMLILQQHPKAADIALFGRMLAENTAFNVEAAAQVAHAFTTHRVTVEDDFYTAVDDLKAKRPGADAGAGFVGVFEFGSGVFYHYANVNLDLLLENLECDDVLAAKALEGLVTAMAVANPKGKQNATAARARAGFVLAEIGERAPRSLAEAFLKPVLPRDEEDLLAVSVEALLKKRGEIDGAYGKCWEDQRQMQVGGEGSLAEIVTFAHGLVAPDPLA